MPSDTYQYYVQNDHVRLDFTGCEALKISRDSGPFLLLSVCWCLSQVKVGLKFKDGWPVIERVRISFGTAPYLEMAAYPIYNSGVDVTELPGLASWMVR